MADGLYLTTFRDALNGDLALDLNDTTAGRFKMGLVTNLYAPDFSTHTGWSNVSPYEVSGTGYTAGGAAVTGVTFTKSGGLLVWDCDDVSWSSSSISAAAAVLYDDSLIGDPLIGFFGFGQTLTSASSTFTVTIPSGGAFTLDLTP